MQTQPILDSLYPAAGLRRSRGRRRLLRHTALRLKENIWHLLVCAVLLVGWVAAHLYYYNKLVDMEFNVQEAWAQMENQWLRRHHIQQNVVRLIAAYERHERSLLVYLTRMRTGKKDRSPRAGEKESTGPGAPLARANPASTGQAPPLDLDQLRTRLDRMKPGQLNDLFPQIQLMAEQYPSLRLSENFQQLSKAVIETEDKIASRVHEYNRLVNVYTTTLKQFPGNVFGWVCGFGPYEFYNPDRRSIEYRPIDYEADG